MAGVRFTKLQSRPMEFPDSIGLRGKLLSY